MIGTVRPGLAKFRIARVADTPSISGICTSINTTSYDSCDTAATACLPFTTMSGLLKPCFFNRVEINVAMMGLSSATRILKERPASGTSAGDSIVQGSPGLHRTVNQNVLPALLALLTPMVPLIMVQSCLQIASPSPLPPYFREIDVSA